ncbi:uncharacterized protein PGTG_18207 [Puccinia graminis f. sp. tritici CRL 75-36-700-3]|uniref:Uncharacterized protein n=1 Tax=Puccinia graminis f. sp. tritici (strain CRL 75-36-700-3 / race SCCL) TaxID=418459 RepID=E3L817_PUCGT|nr:uncharacterized protein PGTG_18207 [Puccinia graminis f. sp. tritici CRL 75-36-700-3]EFP92692.2 hypothetical protein PGTG_18207 [Puccinia graminis f. sp. tritici CRL 75-36-700-3]
MTSLSVTAWPSPGVDEGLSQLSCPGNALTKQPRRKNDVNFVNEFPVRLFVAQVTMAHGGYIPDLAITACNIGLAGAVR